MTTGVGSSAVSSCIRDPTGPDGEDVSDWLVEFDEPGVWGLYCPPHEMFGMGMRIVVDEATGPATEPETVLEAGSVSWVDLK
ncbi:hypothetical protein GCU68_07765 [Natronorubrum aibiense]|uniref:Blue (type 1) copper domain-containing protein n=1 Tax=Natronorubrum aibiense TaxID=348826 RepID=A0A5P9P2S3_9EURY|nr:hypothetical protein GCU68_07765 [Natronorubrum aibiense]